MRRSERHEIPTEAFVNALENWQAGIYTAMPGIVVSFNPIQITMTVQPAINRLVTDQTTGEQIWTKMPLLLDVPVVLYGGGGVLITSPIKEGDECLVHFADRCIDAWWQNGGTQNQVEFRMHDLSDGFAIVGLRSLARPLTGYSTTSMQLRSDDGNCIIDLNPVTHNITFTCPTLTVNGNVVITGDATINSRDFMAHEHSGVQTGSGHSTGVV